MDIVRHPQANVFLGAPPDWNEAKHGICGVLPAICEEKDRVRTFTSHWKPNEHELALLNNGGCIALKIYSAQHPPVSLWTERVETPARGVEEVKHVQAEPEPARITHDPL